MHEPSHALSVRWNIRWETRDGRVSLYRDRDGKWRAHTRSTSDHSVLCAAGLSSSSGLGFELGLGLRETAAALANIVGGDPRVRQQRWFQYWIEADGERLPYCLFHVEEGWQTVEYRMYVRRRIGAPHRTQAGALEALAGRLASSSTSEVPA